MCLDIFWFVCLFIGLSMKNISSLYFFFQYFAIFGWYSVVSFILEKGVWGYPFIQMPTNERIFARIVIFECQCFCFFKEEWYSIHERSIHERSNISRNATNCYLVDILELVRYQVIILLLLKLKILGCWICTNMWYLGSWINKDDGKTNKLGRISWSDNLSGQLLTILLD